MAYLKKDIPHIRFGVGEAVTGYQIFKGQPIGLLLVLTYAENLTEVSKTAIPVSWIKKDYPTSRIYKVQP